MKNQS